MLTPAWARQLRPAGQSGVPNIIIILWDAFSAMHASLYGYPRLTTPNVDEFAENSTVYHNHYSGSNFTTTGTASMLSGMLAWKHRAINLEGLVSSRYARYNPFTLLGNEYHRFIFSQNPWPYRLVAQYQQDVDQFLPISSYSLVEQDLPSAPFTNDRTIASIALEGFLLPAQGGDAPAGSAFAGQLHKSYTLNYSKNQTNHRYPKGFPEMSNPGYVIPYRNEQLYDGVYFELEKLSALDKPYFAYFHLFSPHGPFRARQDYQSLFRDDYTPPAKPADPLSAGLGEEYLLSQRTQYDRQVAQIDDEFGRLIARLRESGIMDNSYILFTSDHGSLFERGYVAHGKHYLYEPVIKIPLVIHAPGQTVRHDVHSLTSNIDLLPTLLTLTGREIPLALDGKPLPGFGGEPDEDRSLFSMAALDNSAFAPITKASISLRKGDYKLIAYPGYDPYREPELFHLLDDPHELRNIAANAPEIFNPMWDELQTRLDEANKSFMNG